jgi:TonB family protein
MAENPRLARDQICSLHSRTGEGPDRVNLLPPLQTSEEIAAIARKIALHGGGPASLDLALDLVLHDIVELARDAVGATGAAVALISGGEMVCRATTGENAPDLGMRVETTSGLVGVCLSTGDIQCCHDAETDTHVNREACRLLGVRSMLVLPLGEADQIFGLMEVFSSSPNAFGDKQIALLGSLARRITESIADVCQRANGNPGNDDLFSQAREQEFEKQDCDTEVLPQEAYRTQRALTGKANEVWTSILFVAVLAAAVTLGIVVGWSGGVKTRSDRVPARPTGTHLPSAQTTQNSSSPVNSSSTVKRTVPQSFREAISSPVPDGGLLITQDGKVLYRSSGSPTTKNNALARSDREERRLIHRVEPEYPSDARARHIEGTVVLNTEIQANGQVGTVFVVSGDPLLSEAAIRAVKQWRYGPAPSASQSKVSLNFVLPAN